MKSIFLLIVSLCVFGELVAAQDSEESLLVQEEEIVINPTGLSTAQLLDSIAHYALIGRPKNAEVCLEEVASG